MIGEMNFFGVFVPAILTYTLISLCLLTLLRWLLSATGAYRLLWHRALVDFSLLILILFAVTKFLPSWIS